MEEEIGQKAGTVVVGIDFADRTEVVVTEGLALARATGGDLVLVHAAAGEPGFAGYDGDDLESHTRDARAAELTEEHHRLRELAEHSAAAAPGTEVRPVIAVGPTAATLLRVADDVDASHLVVGSHGHGGLRHLLVGSVTEELLRHTDRPVVVVPVRPA